MNPNQVYTRCISGVVSISAGSSLSSGFFIDRTHIVTCSHCVKKKNGSPEMDIKVFADVPGGKIMDAKVLGVDGVADVAVLEVQHPVLGITPLKWTSSVDRGDEYILIGTPYGDMQSISVGYVRDISFYGSSLLSPVMESILIDNSALGGNSGGPLLTRNGDVMGILAYGYSDLDGGFMNGAVSYVVAAPIVASILSKRIDHIYGTLGAKVAPLYINDCIFLGLDIVQGYLILTRNKNIHIDIQEGDIILDILLKGKKYAVGQLNSQQCIFSLIHLNPGETITMDIIRVGVKKTISFKIPSMSSTVPQSGDL